MNLIILSFLKRIATKTTLDGLEPYAIMLSYYKACLIILSKPKSSAYLDKAGKVS